MAKSFQDLQKDGLFRSGDFIEVPIRIKDGILELEIETDLGKQRVILDTGASFCSFKNSKVDPDKIKTLPSGKRYVPTQKVMIQGCDFGVWGFALASMSDQIDADGVLGVDFFLEHAVCFDFAKKIAYIKKPESLLGTQWKRGKFYVSQFFLRNFINLPKVEAL